MKTVVICAHMDDEAISCGGLLANRAAKGHSTDVLALFGRKYPSSKAHPDALNALEYEDFKLSCLTLGVQGYHCSMLEEGEPFKLRYYDILGAIEGHIAKHQPEEVVIHGLEDRNQDHKLLHDICNIALRPAALGSVTRVLEMLPLDGWTTAGSKNQPNYFVALSKAQLETKLSAVACYRKESRTVPHPRCPENIEAHARIMGSACGHEFAEGYRLVFQRE